jgi:hypothetical protein
MEIKPLNTVRFTKLVEESGKPAPITLWTEPEQDRDFTKAMHETRVVTVVQRNVGTKADYGLVGFFKEPLATYLVFPKKLQHPPETKVVGIKYEQLAEPKTKGARHKPKAEASPGIRMRETVASRKAESAARQAPKNVQEHHPEPRRPQPEAPNPPPQPPEPRLYRFRANVEITVRQILPVEVEARTAKEAHQLVKEKMQQLEPDLSSATLKKRASAPTRI